MSTLSTLLRYVYVFQADAVGLFSHAARLCLVYPSCSNISISTLLRYDYFSMPSHYVFLFHDVPLCPLFPRCCALYTFSILLLRFDYFFHAAALCLLFPRCSTKTTLCADPGILSGGGGGGGVQVNPTKNEKSFDNVFFFL